MATKRKKAAAPKPAYVKKTQLVNATKDKTQSLQDFVLPDLQQFTLEGVYSNNASKDFHLFYVGRDNVHEILKYVLSRISVSLYLNMFGYDDEELNQIIMQKIMDPSITVMITLDSRQAGGKTEKALLAQDQKGELKAFSTHIVVGESLTGQISHTKGFVADGKIGAEGSVNWSSSGQGTFPAGAWQVEGANAPKGPITGLKGYKAQNNTQSVFVDPDSISRFQTELIAEHMIAQKNAATAATNKASAGTTTKPAAAKSKKAPAKAQASAGTASKVAAKRK